MPGQLDEISAAIGGLQADVNTLSKTVLANQEASTREHRLVHDIVVATSEAVRNLARVVDEMKPLTDDYREKRAEGRGRSRMIHAMYVSGGGLMGALAARLLDILNVKPHP